MYFVSAGISESIGSFFPRATNSQYLGETLLPPDEIDRFLHMFTHALPFQPNCSLFVSARHIDASSDLRLSLLAITNSRRFNRQFPKSAIRAYCRVLDSSFPSQDAKNIRHPDSSHCIRVRKRPIPYPTCLSNCWPLIGSPISLLGFQRACIS